MVAPIVTPAADLTVRRTGLGGSDMARILGLSRFGGPMDVYMEKIGQSAPLMESEPMRWGKLLEPSIADEYAVRSGRKVRRAAAFLRHPAYDFIYANIDRWSLLKGTPKRVLECKTASVFFSDDFGEPGTDQVPDDYLVQVMHYLWVTGTTIADLAVLVGGQRFAIYTIHRDDDLIADMEREAVTFWENTQARIPPDIDTSEGTREYLRRTYRDTETERPMDDRLVHLATAYEGLRLEIKDAQARREELGNRIRDLMGNARWAEGEGVKVTYGSQQSPRKVDWPRIAEAAKVPPALIEEFTERPDPIRVLRVVVKPA